MEATEFLDLGEAVKEEVSSVALRYLQLLTYSQLHELLS